MVNTSFNIANETGSTMDGGTKSAVSGKGYSGIHSSTISFFDIAPKCTGRVSPRDEDPVEIVASFVFTTASAQLHLQEGTTEGTPTLRRVEQFKNYKRS